jgi:hypothetical protein
MKPSTEITMPSHWPVQLGQERKLPGGARRLVGIKAAQAIGFALCGTLRVGVLPRLNVPGVDCVALKIAGAALSRAGMKTRTHFAHRIDTWDDAGDNIIEHVASVENVRVR